MCVLMVFIGIVSVVKNLGPPETLVRGFILAAVCVSHQQVCPYKYHGASLDLKIWPHQSNHSRKNVLQMGFCESSS